MDTMRGTRKRSTHATLRKYRPTETTTVTQENWSLCGDGVKDTPALGDAGCRNLDWRGSRCGQLSRQESHDVGGLQVHSSLLDVVPHD